MTARLSRMGRTAVTCALALAAFAVPAAAARRADARPRGPIVVPPEATAPQGVTVMRDSLDADRLALRRAAFEHARGDFAAVVRVLGPLSIDSTSAFAERDRAAFLLGHALLRLGQRERFASLARAVAAWPEPSAFTRWIAFEHRLNADPQVASGAARTGQAMADALAANELLRAGDPAAVLELVPEGAKDPLLLHLRSVALERLERDPTRELEALARAGEPARNAGPSSAIARDLAGSALLRLATIAAGRGADPRPWLELVPEGNRFAARARHMHALATLERGDKAAGRAALDRLLATDTLYVARREVAQALAGEALDQGRWQEAYERYAAVDAEWKLAHASLMLKLAPEAADSLWAVWERGHALSGALVLDGLPAAALTERLALEAADLARAPGGAEPAVELADGGVDRALDVPPPASDAWDRVAASERALATVAGEHVLALDSLARERARLGDARRYLGGGLAQVRANADSLAQSSRTLDSLRAAMDETAQALMALRDAATLRFQGRAAWLLARAEALERWIQAMDHLYLQGPDARRQAATPPTHKGPDVVLAQEKELVQSLRFSARRILEGTPGRTAAAYERAWGPRLIDRVGAMADGTRDALAWARAIESSVDSNLALTHASPEEARLAAREAELGTRAGALATSHRALRVEVARDAVAAAMRALESEREGLDYGLAAASYARAVKLSAADSVQAPAAIAGGEPGGDPFEAASDSASRAERAEAISRASIFLADHPASAARGEMRFRLADLLVTEARTEFRDRMAAYLRNQESGRPGTLPVVDHAQPLALYRAILAEDPDLPHRDAVLFNAGMLLADAGDPAAGEYFTRLLAEHPTSAYVQEASLRLGDLAFDAQQLGDGVTHYQRAAAGADPSLTAIALYKTGWAHYNADRFEAAADAFRGVLDLYAGDARLAIQADIEHEAEQYFVYSLAAAGGAAAYERVFPEGANDKPYAKRVLRAMGQHFRRYGEFADAATVDRLYLQRWPSDPAALDVVGRLAETQQRAERPAEERATRLEWAEKFAPGGAWAQAQASDSLKQAGAEFARSAWRDEAFDHHRQARTSGSRDEWRAALRHYERLLERWPGDSAAAVYELHAGEAAVELGDHRGSLDHYARAAAGGRDSVAARARWQRVAVTDRWYESTRPAAAARGAGPNAARGAGSDTLARAVIAAVEELLKQEPRHPQAADLVWRENQLAMLHGWNDEALAGLARFARQFPDDKRAPLAASERASVYFRAGDFHAAGEAFAEAAAVARRAGVDSLARRAERALPVCAWREAEAAVAADSSKHARHAELFARVAERWPAYEHAAVAQYRAGLAWFAAGRTDDGARAMQALTTRWPNQPLARDARLRSAQAWEADRQPEKAATAWLEFSEKHPQDPDADEAWLRAIDLSDSAGRTVRADELRKAYLDRWPSDEETALELLEVLAKHEFAALPQGRSVTTLLARPKPKAGTPAGPAPYFAQYLKRVAKQPAKASKPLLAEFRFRHGEEVYQLYASARLTQPLPPSIAAKQRLLDSVLVRYRRTVDMGVPSWAHAATFRIGEALVGFGEALEKSERPADLTGDDLKAYDNVLLEQGMSFHDRGESVWTELLERNPGVADAWITRARTALWGRMGDRFLFRAESDFPVVQGNGPGKAKAPRADAAPESLRTKRIAGEDER